MTGTFFPLMALQTSEAPFIQIPTGSSVSGNNPPEDPSFFDLFQRHTSGITVGKTRTDVQSFLQRQPSLEATTPSLSQESLEVLEAETFSNVLPGVIDPVPLTDSRVFHARKGAESVPGFWGGENTSIVHAPVPGGESESSESNVERQGSLKDSHSLLAFQRFQQSEAVPGSFSVVDQSRSSGVGPAGSAESTVQEVLELVSPIFEQGKMNMPTGSPLFGEDQRRGQENQNPDVLKHAGLPSPPENKVQIPDAIKGQEKFLVDDSGIDDLPEKGVDVPPRRVMFNQEPADPQKIQSILPRSMSIVEQNGQHPESPVPMSPQVQSVSGGFALRPEAGGAVMGGRGYFVNEPIPDTGGSKPDLVKVQGIGDVHGTNGGAHEEAGMQGGMGGFSHSQSGHQSFQSQSGQLPVGNRMPAEVSPELPPQPIQRLQLDVQISETQRVQIDVGVQHRQVYAGLVMDHMALRNLALQNVPQLEEQFTNINMELSEFSAKTPEDEGSEADRTFQGRKPFFGTQDERGSGFHSQRGTVSRSTVAAEAGLHFVA